MQKSLSVVMAAALVLALLSGCAARRQSRVLHTLQHPEPVNCATADGDLRMLRAEKAHVAQRVAEGVTAIYPAGLVIGLVTRTEGTKIKVATGDYNDAIDKRIAHIKEACGIE